MFQQLKSWLNLAEIGQSRSSITNPLQWAMVILIVGILVLVLERAPSWIVMILIGCLLLVVAIFIYTYLYCMHKQPDVLRSEQYQLSKIALDRGMLGDSITGLIEANRLPTFDPKLLSSGTRQGQDE